MRALIAAVVLTATLALAASAAASKVPTGTQALAIVKAILAKQQVPCTLSWKKMSAQPQTMDGPPWKVTVTGLATTKGSGTAIWLVAATMKPANALATAISNGCR